LIKSLLRKIIEKNYLERNQKSDNYLHKLIYKGYIKRYLFCKNFFSNKRILDVACGDGFGSYLLSENNKKVIGLDIDKYQIKNNKSNFIRRNLDFMVGDATNLKFKNNYFDAIVSFETIEHTQNTNQFLSELKRVLKKDGFLLISSINKKFTKGLFKDEKINKFHLREFTKEELIEDISKYFKIISIYRQRPIRKNVFVKYLDILGYIIKSPIIVRDSEDISGTNNIILCKK